MVLYNITSFPGLEYSSYNMTPIDMRDVIAKYFNSLDHYVSISLLIILTYFVYKDVISDMLMEFFHHHETWKSIDKYAQMILSNGCLFSIIGILCLRYYQAQYAAWEFWYACVLMVFIGLMFIYSRWKLYSSKEKTMEEKIKESL